MNYLNRGLTYIPLKLATAKLFIFVDGYEVIIANETTGQDEFNIKGNLIHWSSTKSKRITRSILASEIYSMIAGTNITFVIGLTLKLITK
jgi:hypothetical protein